MANIRGILGVLLVALYCAGANEAPKPVLGLGEPSEIRLVGEKMGVSENGNATENGPEKPAIRARRQSCGVG